MKSESPLLWTEARVRPASHPVPPELEGTVAGKIFARLARMNDGPAHDALRKTVEDRIAGLTAERLERAAGECAVLLADGDGFVERFPIYVLARSLGIASIELDRVFPAARDFARALGAGADEDALARGVPAAEVLFEAFARVSPERSFDEIANDVGFMFQGYAGMRALLRAALAAPLGTLTEIVFEEPPIPATRRFLGDEEIPVPLQGRPFGDGAHACPGRDVALAIVELGVRYFSAG
jgi:hypothetical protein